ncbi:MAG TPA: agmatinase [Alphaproteobacteria bacterium]|nr:agmatinase [Alphaproteobacteria bacterium]
MNDAPHLKPLDSACVPRFSAIATFMRTPAVEISSALDIALVGVPFDLGTTFRAGSRQGPAQIREMSRLIRQVNPTNGLAPFRLCNVGDVGDAPVNPLDLMGSIASITAFFERIHASGVAPISAGGDHTVTYPILKGIVKDGPVGVIHFDAHGDTLDELLGNKVNHGTPFRRAVEEGLIDPKRMIQIGLRGTRYGDDDLRYGQDTGMCIVTMDDYEAMGRAKVIEQIRKTVGDGATYITFDIDGLDPVYAIGTGVPEPGGLSMRDSQVMLRSLVGLDIIGGDVCEVSPPLDPSGHTALNAANLMFEMLCVTADAVARRKRAGRR